jgi:hypothetical protein
MCEKGSSNTAALCETSALLGGSAVSIVAKRIHRRAAKGAEVPEKTINPTEPRRWYSKP